MTKLNLKKVKAGLYDTNHNGLHIDFYKLPSDGLWRSSYFERDVFIDHIDYHRPFLTLKTAKMVVEKYIKAAA